MNEKNKEKIKKLYELMLKERDELFNKHLKVINKYNPHGIHGQQHIINVLYYVVKMKELMGLTDDEMDILITSALYHDIGRTHDGVDDNHGMASYRIFRKTDIFKKDKKRDYIKYLIEQHPIEDKEAFENIKYYKVDYEKGIKLLNIFKDCDGLDRVRLGDFNPLYLRLDESYELINLSLLCNV